MAGTRAPILTPKQARFVELLLENGGNNSDAYRRAFDKPKDAYVAGSAGKLRSHPLVIEALERAAVIQASAVEAVLDRYAITADRLAEEMARLAFTELRQVVDVSTSTDPASGKRRQRVTLRDFSAIDADAHRALVEVRQSASGEVTVKLADKRGAIMDLARLKGLIVDRPPEQKQLVMLKIER